MEKWVNTGEKFVAFFDILGFKEYIIRTSHDDVYATMKKISNIQQKISVVNDSKHGGGSLKSTIFSDSLLVVSNGNTRGDYFKINAAAIFILARCIESGIPIKGAMSYGLFTYDFEKSIYFGQPLIDAYLLQEDLFLYGCILDNKAEQRALLVEEEKKVYPLLKYKTPFKTGKITHKNINWITYFDAVTQLTDRLSACEEFYSSVSGKPRQYVDNTIDFVNKFWKPLK